MIIPINDNVLIELQSKYKHASSPNASPGRMATDTKSKGLCMAVAESLNEGKELLGKVVYFDEFEDTTNYLIDGKRYALIKLKDIRGHEE